MQRRGRPPRFSRADLIAAACRLGPDALTLPALAEELGIGRTTLYWHVRDADEVGAMVLASLTEDGSSPGWEPDPQVSWNEALESYARMVRGRLVAAGPWIRYATPQLVFTPAQFRAMDGLVRVLRACGFPIDEATRAYAYLFQVVLGSLGSGDAPVVEMHRALVAELEAMDLHSLDTLREVVATASKTSPAAQFEYDLDCTLRGIAARSGITLGTLPGSDGEDRRSRRAP